MRAILFVLLFLSYHALGQEVDYKDLKLKIDSIVSKHNFNGVVSISSGEKDIYTKAFGFSDLENEVELNFNDQFVIGSISKQITAVLLLREYENGKIGLHDKIGQYLMDIEQSWVNTVTVHQLLTHTHGIVELDEPLEFKSGTQFRYSQLGYELLAQILQNITGKSFKALSSELFDQFELKNTFHPETHDYKQLVKGYEENEDGQLELSTSSLNNYAAAGSFISNASDLVKWNELLYAGKLVSEDVLKLMKTRYATRIHPIFNTIEYGYGLLFKANEQDLEIGALGYAPGFVSASYYYSKSQLNLVILENTANDLDDFRKTFVVHTTIMELLRNICK